MTNDSTLPVHTKLPSWLSPGWSWGISLGMLLLLSCGCGGLRPMNWLIHNTFASTCKTCPGGMPGPNGCRSFSDPWCAGYQTRMWRVLGTNCGPARPDLNLQAPTPAGSGAPETSPQRQAADAPPDLPSDLTPKLPGPDNLPEPDGGVAPPPDLLPGPLGTGNPENKFPLTAPTNPLDADPGLLPPTPGNKLPPSETPDFFTEPFPGEKTPPPGTKKPATAPGTKSPSGEKTPTATPAPETKTPPVEEKKPAVPVAPENIDDLFNLPGPGTSKSGTPAEKPGTKLTEDLPEPTRKTPATPPTEVNNLFPENKTPAGNKEEKPATPASEVPNIFPDSATEKQPAAEAPPEKSPMPPVKSPMEPESPERIPTLDNLDIFEEKKPESKNSEVPEKKPDSNDSEEKPAPKLFDDNAYQQPGQGTPNVLRFRQVIPASATEEPRLKVQAAGGEVDLGGSIYGVRQAFEPGLRIMPE